MKKLLLLLLIISSALLASCGGTASDTGAAYTCTVSISCAELIGEDALDESKRELVPEDGQILPACEVSFTDGEDVFDVLMRVCRENRIHLEYTEAPMYNTVYIEGIANLYEFDAGALSGWVYTVNGVSPNIGSASYTLSDGDTVEWTYTVSGRQQ